MWGTILLVVLLFLLLLLAVGMLVSSESEKHYVMNYRANLPPRKWKIRFNGELDGEFAYSQEAIVVMEFYSNTDACIQAREQGYTIISRIFEYTEVNI